jgi:hypothetical protein
MKIKFLLTLFSTLVLRILVSQNMDISWSNKMRYDNNFGYFNSIIGENDNYLYAKFSLYSGFFRIKQRKITIKAFDKKTMKEVNSTVIYDKKSKKFDAFDHLNYHKTVVLNNIIFVFWINDKHNSEELFVSTYSIKMMPIKKLKKIYELKKEEGRNFSRPEIFVIYNPKVNNNVLIGAEPSVAKGNPTKFEYMLIDDSLNILSEKKIELPIVSNGTSRFSSKMGLSSNYSYEDNGILYLKTSITPSRDEYRELKGNKKLFSSYYTLISAINPADGSFNSYPIKLENKHTQSCALLPDSNSLKVVGFFTDLNKDPKGNDKHGLYHIDLNARTLNLNSLSINEFSGEQLNKLFEKDIADRKDRTGIFTSQQKRQSEVESIPSDYVIESTTRTKEGDVVIFSSIMNNYSRTYCNYSTNGVTSCRTVYYCEKNNVTAFKISNDGKIRWLQNLDREKTYLGTSIYDINVISKNNQYYVTYGSDFQTMANKKNNASRKSSKQLTDKLEYAIFNDKDGAFVKNEEKINGVNASKDNKKYVLPNRIDVINNTFYVSSERHKTKVIPTILAVIFFPIGIFMINSGTLSYSDGYVGKISPK